MGCCVLVLIAVGVPRVALALLYFNDYVARAYQTHLWPLLGFLLMPWTTIAYAVCQNEMGGVNDWGVALLILGVALDLGTNGSASRAKPRRGGRSSDAEAS